MHIPVLYEPYLRHAAEAVAWTLFHSLWQGLIAALLAALIVVGTRRSPASTRYNLLTALFLLLTMAFAATFAIEWQIRAVARNDEPASTSVAVVAATHLHSLPVINNTETRPLSDTIIVFFSRNSPLVAAIWLMILSMKMTRMLFVLAYTRRIMRRKTHRPPPCWQDRLTQLCRDWQIGKTIDLLESKFIRLPVVYGQLKPVILVPLGFLTQLPPTEIESILLHELAHIRRGDYLVNLLQNGIEAVFFFNPGLLWISSLIRDERENCCDDQAITWLKDTKQYVHSLIMFRERSIYASPLSAVGFAGRKNTFINRISRIVENKNYTLSRFEAGSLVCSTVIAALLAFLVMTANGTRAMTIRVMAPAAPIEQPAPYMPVAKPAITSSKIRHPMTTHPSVRRDTAAVQNFQLDMTVLKANGKPHKPGHGYFIVERPGQVQDQLSMEQAQQAQLQAREDLARKRQELMQRRQGMARLRKDSMRIHFLQPVISDIIDDLVAAGIVDKRTDVVSFLLTNRELVVNRLLQPIALHQTFREKYILHNTSARAFPDNADDPYFGWQYNAKTGRMGIGYHYWGNASD